MIFKVVADKRVRELLFFWPRDDLDRHDGPSSSSEISFFKRFCSIINEEHFLEEDNFFLLQKKMLYYKLDTNGEEIDNTTFSWRKILKDFEMFWKIM